MNIFDITESLSLDGMLVITCEKPTVSWRKGLKLGPIHSDETRAKMSAAKKGQPRAPRSAEHIAKLTAANTGRIRSAETRAKISAANKGRLKGPLPAETRAKISTVLSKTIYNGLTVREWADKLNMTVGKIRYYLKRDGNLDTCINDNETP